MSDMSQIQQYLIELISSIGIWGVLLSILINVILSFVPIPSFVITVVNLTVYGPIYGFLISLIGESVAAVISFLVFRKGLKEVSREKIFKFEKFSKLLDAKPREAFNLVLVFRLFPYVPSGIITYFAACGEIGLIPFTISSTIGKIPAMAIEVALVYIALQLPLIPLLAIVSSVLIIIVVKRILNEN